MTVAPDGTFPKGPLAIDGAPSGVSARRPACMGCPTNSTLSTIVLNEGFWRLSGSSTDIIECSNGEGGSPCLGGSESGPNGAGYCRDGHMGPRCEVCLSALWL